MAPATAQVQSAAFASATPAPRAEPKPEVVDGVPLIPTTKTQRAECQSFADHLKRPVPCPGLLPDPIPVSTADAGGPCLHQVGAFSETSCGPAGIQLDGDLFELSQANFEVPPGYVGVTYQQYSGTIVPLTSISGGPLGHFVFMSGTDLPYVMTHKRGKGAVPVPSYCAPSNPASRIRVHGSVAELYQCADSRTSAFQIEIVTGHTLLVWNDAGVTCEVSFHGHSQVNVDLDVAVANATTLESPRKR
ncbi:MAG TPA: hypothetical protein VK773_12315 [Acidimicrobiales bacterium]|nr:hypothetical protein [Acidimicrobiales bacterium]